MSLSLNHRKNANWGTIIVVVLMIFSLSLLNASETSTFYENNSKVNYNNNVQDFLANASFDNYGEIGQWNDNFEDMVRVFVNGTTAFVKAADGLLIFDISNISAPILVGNYNDGESIDDCFFLGDLAFTLDWEGFKIIDLQYPNHPKVIGEYTSYETTWGYNHIFVEGGFVYLSSSSGLEIIDIDNFSDMEKIGGFNDGGSIFRIFVSGGLAFLAKGDSGVDIIDVHDPTNPTKVGVFAEGRVIYNVFVSEDLAYLIAGGNYFQIIDISNSSLPQKIGEVDVGRGAQDFCISGNFAFIIGSNAGLEIFDCSNPLNITKIGEFKLGGNPSDIFVVDDYAYITDWDEGLEIIDVHSPTSPKKIAQIGGGQAIDITVSGELAFIAEGVGGLEIVNVTDPTVPQEIAQFAEGGEIKNSFVVDSLVYLATANGLEIVDISEPTKPTKIGGFFDGGTAQEVFVSGDFAFIADGDDGLEIIDISDPANPFEVGGLLSGSYFQAQTIFVLDNIVYLGCEDALYIINVSDVSNPVQLDRYSVTSYRGISGILVADSLAYLCKTSLEDFEIIDVSDPTNARRIYIDDMLAIHNIFLDGNYLYGVNGNGFVVFNTSDPSNVEILGEFPQYDCFERNCAPVDLFVVNDLIYLVYNSRCEDLQIISFDSDNDGLLDYFETQVFGTDPNNPDTDSDGLSDFEEINHFGTDPTNPDTDGDGYNDKEEIRRGSDPLDPNSVPSVRVWLVIVIVLSSVISIALLAFLAFIAARRFKEFKKTLDKKKRELIKENEQRLYEFLVSLTDGTEYSLEKFAEALEIEQEEIAQTLILWSDAGDLEKIGQYDPSTGNFIRKITHEYPNNQGKCYYCAKAINIKEALCPYCGFEVPRCPCCNMPICYEELTGSCAFCEAIAHLDHFFAYVQSEGHCPACNRRLTISEINILSKPSTSKVQQK